MDAGLRLFSQGLREHVLVEREVGDEPFQPPILLLQLPEPTQFAHPQVSVLLLPGVKRGVTHPELPAEVVDRGAGFCLSDRVHDLFLREL
jgi:hypothetical protein